MTYAVINWEECELDYIFDAMVALVAAIITYYLIPLIQSKTSEAQQETIATWVEVAVAAAEQLFDSDQGSEKLTYVVEYLAKLGFDVTTEEIESAVYWLHNAMTQETEVVTGE